MPHIELPLLPLVLGSCGLLDFFRALDGPKVTESRLKPVDSNSLGAFEPLVIKTYTRTSPSPNDFSVCEEYFTYVRQMVTFNSCKSQTGSRLKYANMLRSDLVATYFIIPDRMPARSVGLSVSSPRKQLGNPLSSHSS